MNLDLQTQTKWILRTLGWTVALLIIFVLIHKITLRKQGERTVNCLDQASSEERASSALASVDKYARCMVGKEAMAANSRPARCRYAGLWAATRGETVYEMTLEPGGKFIGVPAQNAPENAPTVTGAWAVAGRALAWAYDSGAVWPPDINPISAETDKAFTLTEGTGEITRYTLMVRHVSAACNP